MTRLIAAHPVVFMWVCPNCKTHNAVVKDELSLHKTKYNVCLAVDKTCRACGKEVKVCVDCNLGY